MADEKMGTEPAAPSPDYPPTVYRSARAEADNKSAAGKAETKVVGTAEGSKTPEPSTVAETKSET
jgi:hypothetical protein